MCRVTQKRAPLIVWKTGGGFTKGTEARRYKQSWVSKVWRLVCNHSVRNPPMGIPWELGSSFLSEPWGQAKGTSQWTRTKTAPTKFWEHFCLDRKPWFLYKNRSWSRVWHPKMVLYTINHPLDQVDILHIIDPNIQILIQRFSLELCISEDQDDAMMKSFNREEQAGERIPIMISFHTKITKHLMIST